MRLLRMLRIIRDYLIGWLCKGVGTPYAWGLYYDTRYGEEVL